MLVESAIVWFERRWAIQCRLQLRHKPNAELALPNPYVSNINSAGNDDTILLTNLNISKPSAGSQLKCDE